MFFVIATKAQGRVSQKEIRPNGLGVNLSQIRNSAMCALGNDAYIAESGHR